jgi:predicted DNA-binding transcriptional regulator YafY
MSEHTQQQKESVRHLLAVARCLRTNQPFTAPSLCGKCNVSSRTIKRDIALLRSFGWKIYWNNGGNDGAYILISAPKPVL